MVEPPGIEPRDTSVRGVVKRRVDDADRVTRNGAKRREVSGSTPMSANDAIRVAAKLAIDVGDFACARGCSIYWRIRADNACHSSRAEEIVPIAAGRRREFPSGRPSRAQLRPNGLHSYRCSQQYLFVERADRDSFALREPNVESVRSAKLTCNRHA
jgi:hypothetical protein